MAKKRESAPGENLAKQIIEQYNPKSVADISDDTDKLEGFNNKIKVAKRIGYGYRDSLSFYSFCPFTIPQKIVMNHFFISHRFFVLLFYLIFKTTARVNFIFSGSKL